MLVKKIQGKRSDNETGRKMCPRLKKKEKSNSWEYISKYSTLQRDCAGAFMFQSSVTGKEESDLS